MCCSISTKFIVNGVPPASSSLTTDYKLSIDIGQPNFFHIAHNSSFVIRISLFFYEDYKQNSNALRVYYFVFDVMNAIFQYDVVLISSNGKIIRYIF